MVNCLHTHYHFVALALVKHLHSHFMFTPNPVLPYFCYLGVNFRTLKHSYRKCVVFGKQVNLFILKSASPFTVETFCLNIQWAIISNYGFNYFSFLNKTFH